MRLFRICRLHSSVPPHRLVSLLAAVLQSSEQVMLMIPCLSPPAPQSRKHQLAAAQRASVAPAGEETGVEGMGGLDTATPPSSLPLPPPHSTSPPPPPEEKGAEEGVMEGEGDGDVVLEPEVCLFCDLRCRSVDEAVRHMLKRHGFFIPDAEYLVDVPGLLVRGWTRGT
jgi:hypothetical protein